MEVMAQRRQGFFVAAAAEEEYFRGGRGWKEVMGWVEEDEVLNGAMAT